MPSMCQAYAPLGSSGSPNRGKDLIHHPKVEKIANKLNKSPEQIILKWAQQRGTSVIPKSSILTESRKISVSLVGKFLKKTSKFFDVFLNRLFDGESLFVCKEAGPSKSSTDLWDNEN
ncbi:hypothetical protein ACFE04_002160 [Oxalis oulophora]